MNTKFSVLYILLLIYSFEIAFAQNCNDNIHEGEGTFYAGVAGSSSGNCSLPVDNGDFLHCALNTIDYNNSNACGACIEVNGPSGIVFLTVVDRCPECAVGDVDMTQEAFAMIADPIDGRVPITWKFVPCQTEKKIDINFKEGSSEFWTAIQFRNVEHAISLMEYRNNSNQWTHVNRELFNFFIEPNGIPSPMTLRVTSVLGEQLVFENISINVNADYPTGQQFSTPEECETLSTQDLHANTLKMYPNPTVSIAYFKNPNREQWVLFNHNGQVIKKGNTEYVNVSELQNGMYFIFLSGVAQKILKE